MSDLNRETIQNIQFLRGVSALLVVFFHLGPIYAAFGIPQFGGGGVDVFFVISGFIMAHTNKRKPVGSAAFFTNRIRRIAPLYWLVTLFVFCLALAVPGLMKSVHTSVPELIKSLFFIPFERNGVVVDPVLFLGWTLNYEMFFYLVFAMGLFFPGTAGLGFSMCVLVVLAGLGSMLDGLSPIGKFYTNPIILEFFFGMAIASVQDRIPARVSVGARRAFMALALVGLVLVIVIPVFWRDMNRAFFSGLPAMLLVGASVALEKWRMRVNSRLFLLVGASSYSLYLVHIFVTESTIRLAHSLKLNIFGSLSAVIASVAASCIAGLLVYKFIEAPIQRGNWRALVVPIWNGRKDPALR